MLFLINPLAIGNHEISALANIADPDEMQHNAAFHRVLHCLLRLKQASGTEIHHYLEKKSTCDHLKYTVGRPIHIVMIRKGNFIKIQRVKYITCV